MPICGSREVWEPMMAYLDHQPGPEVALGGTHYRLYGHDWRRVPPAAFFDMMAEREILGTEAAHAASSPGETPPLAVLARETFAAAVRDALKAYTQPDALEQSPLLRCRLVREAALPARRHVLQELIELAVDQLSQSGKDEKRFAALKVTYLDPARSQEEAAELIGLPFSTYRRHLGSGVERVIEWLWQRELSGF